MWISQSENRGWENEDYSSSAEDAKTNIEFLGWPELNLPGIKLTGDSTNYNSPRQIVNGSSLHFKDG